MLKRIACLSLLVSAAIAVPAFALPPFSTAPKAGPAIGSVQAQVAALSVSRHPGFDRIVIRFRFSRPGYKVDYVPKVIADGSGLPVPLLGSRSLLVRLEPARAHTTAGAVVILRVVTPRFPAIRQVKIAGDFEGVVSLGVGINGRKPFRVLALAAPPRIVVDVQH